MNIKISILTLTLAFLPAGVWAVPKALNSDNAYAAERLEKFENGKRPQNILAMPHLAVSPEIDGVISPGEWDHAGSFCGMRDLAEGMILSANKNILMRYGYDKNNFYFLLLIPGDLPRTPKRPDDSMLIFQDGNIIELMFAAPGKDVRRIAFSAAGSMTDMLKLDTSFQSSCTYRFGSIKAQQTHWPATFGYKNSYYFIECALPRKNLSLPEKEFLFNLCRMDSSGLSTLAPVNNSFSDVKNFFTITLLPEKSNIFLGWGHGEISNGSLSLPGIALSVDGRKPKTDLVLLAFKKGTTFKEDTGFDEIHGALESFRRSVTGKYYRIKYRVKNPECDHFEYLLKVDGKLIALINAPLKIHNPLQVKAINYPSQKKVHIVAASGSALPRITFSVSNVANEQVQHGEKKTGELWSLDYSNWKSGKYIVKCQAGKQRNQTEFNVPPKPVWANNSLGMENEVLPGFEPLQTSGRSFKIWNRVLNFKNSVLFTSDEPQVAPQLVITANGKKEPFILKDFVLKKATPLFAEAEITGEAGSVHLKGSVRIEYDGLAWFELFLTSPQERDIDALALETTMDVSYADLYHGSPLRSLNGFIPPGKKDYPWQIYFYVGSRKGGLGYVNESSQAFSGGESSAFSTEKSADKVVFKVNFRPAGKFKETHLSFGLQLTPVKPMPPRYSSFLTDDWGLRRGDKYMVLADHMDFTTVWPRRCKYMDKICDPGGVNYEKLAEAVKESHSRNVSAIPYFAPLSFTENAQQEFVDYYQEWMQTPLRKWKSHDTVNVRCCVNSQYLDYLLYCLDKLQKKSSCDGFYFDGAMPVECSNELHGCGYVDKTGVRRGTYAVRKMREFLRRSAMIAYQNNKKLRQASPRKPGASPYQIWIHISGAVTPPIHSFSTAMFAGEWFKQAIKAGYNYDKLLTIEKFIPRYMGQPWGIPNYFLAIINKDSDLAQYTDCALAYIIPHGTGLYPRYLDLAQVQKILAIKKQFNCDQSSFYPPPEQPAGLKTVCNTKAVAVGSWQNPNGDILLAIGNCTGQEETLTLEGSQVKNAILLHGKAAMKISGQICKLSLPKNSLQMLLLKKQ